MRANFLEASLESSSDLAPVTTTRPEAKIRAVVLGSRMRTTTAAKRFLLYSALRAWLARRSRSTLQPRLKVATTFCSFGSIRSDSVAAVVVAVEEAMSGD